MAQKQTFVQEKLVVGYDYPTIGKKVRIDLSKLDETMREELMVHGAKQRLGDAASGQEPTAKHAMASRIVDALMRGQWNVDAQGVTAEMVIEAVARVMSRKVDEIKAVVAAKPEKVKEWESNAKVKAMIATITAERLATAAKDAKDEIKLD